MAIMKNILFISYFAGVDANCPAEWADDRLRAMASIGFKTYVLTNYGSSLRNNKRMTVYKAPSLSSDDFSHELTLRSRWDVRHSPSEYILRGIVFVFGPMLQMLTRILTRGGSGGKWTWLISATPVGMWLGLIKPIDAVYCTGGPPSSYLIGLIVSWITRKPLKIEFQDPLVGEEINPSAYKQRVVRAVERLLLKNAALCIYVTKKAANDAKTRNPDIARKIIYNYPAAWPFTSDTTSPSRAQGVYPIQILHLGTLYGSRNLDKFFAALDSMYEKTKVKVGELQVTNLGSVYTENAEEYEKRFDFRHLPERQRLDALKIAKDVDFLLLVQHDDRRSAETIPYKLYDYLNLDVPIILLIKNPEIKELCRPYETWVADCSSEDEIASALESVIAKFAGRTHQNGALAAPDEGRLKIQDQVAKILLT